MQGRRSTCGRPPGVVEDFIESAERFITLSAKDGWFTRMNCGEAAGAERAKRMVFGPRKRKLERERQRGDSACGRPRKT